VVRDTATDAMSDPVVIVSSDTHVGPLLEAQLRSYCPKKYLEAFPPRCAGPS
jgi:hypothetical protein